MPNGINLEFFFTLNSVLCTYFCYHQDCIIQKNKQLENHPQAVTLRVCPRLVLHVTSAGLGTFLLITPHALSHHMLVSPWPQIAKILGSSTLPASPGVKA